MNYIVLQITKSTNRRLRLEYNKNIDASHLPSLAEEAESVTARRIRAMMNPHYVYQYESEACNDRVVCSQSSVTDLKPFAPCKTRLIIDDHLEYVIPLPFKRVLAVLNDREAWQNEEYTFTEVERVMETRIDFLRLAA